MIVLPKKLFARLTNYAKSFDPKECCGYLLGHREITKQSTNNLAISRINNIAIDFFEVKNIHLDPQHFFTFSPLDQLHTLQKAKEKNLAIIGIFHSHPNSPAFPSKQDCLYLYESSQSYCIISLRPIPHIASFRVESNKGIIKIKYEKINFSIL